MRNQIIEFTDEELIVLSNVLKHVQGESDIGLPGAAPPTTESKWVGSPQFDALCSKVEKAATRQPQPA
jgi:hypothetical protein